MRDIERIENWILRKLANGAQQHRELSRHIANRDRHYLPTALQRLERREAITRHHRPGCVDWYGTTWTAP